MELMRHPDILLTIAVYRHVELADIRRRHLLPGAPVAASVQSALNCLVANPSLDPYALIFTPPKPKSCRSRS